MAEIHNPITKKRYSALIVPNIASEESEVAYSRTLSEDEKLGRKFFVRIFSGSAVVVGFVVFLTISAHGRKYRTSPVLEPPRHTEIRSIEAMESYKSSFSTKLCRGNRC